MQVPLRELNLRRLWSGIKSAGGGSSGGGSSGGGAADSAFQGDSGGGALASGQEESGGEDGGGAGQGPSGASEAAGAAAAPRSLPLLQVWPSQDSPRGEADGQSFVYPAADNKGSTSSQHLNDSGIDSVQASPTPCPAPQSSPPRTPSPSPCPGRRGSSALSSALLHPDHARAARARLLRSPTSPDHHTSNDDVSLTADYLGSMAISNSSSTASSLNSVTTGNATGRQGRTSDPWLGGDRRRSSTMTARFSLLDALDLDYALRAAAARGSVEPYRYSWSESLHKLTFTQSLAFPALARGGRGHGLSGTAKRPSSRRPPLDGTDTGLNAFAKVVTALVLVLVSVLVFLVVYKFVRT